MVPVVTNVRPSATNAGTLAVDAGSMNCGRNARKKSATLGLSTFVNMPWRNAAVVVDLRNCVGNHAVEHFRIDEVERNAVIAIRHCLAHHLGLF